MTVTDPVADFLTRIRNASKAQRRYTDISWSKMKENLAIILKDQGFIEDFLIKKESENRGVIRLFLKYSSGRNSVIRGLKRVSRPGLRKYVRYDDIPNYFGGLGMSIISTSKGVMTGKQATEHKIGGELLCLVW